MRHVSWLVCGITLVAARAAAVAPVHVRLVTDEADAALAILDTRAAGSAVSPALWARLFDSEGFRRLAKRQQSFGATGVEESMREYLQSAEALAATAGLHAALTRWRSIDVEAAATRAAAYLPAGLGIKATIYPVVKRTNNSFVFEIDTDPAIFLAIDPAPTTEQLANTLAHELHHVGTAGCALPADLAALPETAPARAAFQWLGGFGEGMAVLAAAGSPDHPPHLEDPAGDWIVWQRDLARFDDDVPRLSEFFSGVLAGRWAADEQQKRFIALINPPDVPQGPFYTVGWLMAATVEKALGHQAVVETVCDPRRLLARFDAVAGDHPRGDGGGFATWSTELLRALSGPSAATAAPAP
jgi:hypothetical protein